MKQRKQYVGKPQVYTTLTGYERRISAMERAGVIPTHKVTYVNAPPHKSPIDRPVADPGIVPTIPIVVATFTVCILHWDTEDFFSKLDDNFDTIGDPVNLFAVGGLLDGYGPQALAIDPTDNTTWWIVTDFTNYHILHLNSDLDEIIKDLTFDSSFALYSLGVASNGDVWYTNYNFTASRAELYQYVAADESTNGPVQRETSAFGFASGVAVDPSDDSVIYWTYTNPSEQYTLEGINNPGLGVAFLDANTDTPYDYIQSICARDGFYYALRFDTGTFEVLGVSKYDNTGALIDSWNFTSSSFDATGLAVKDNKLYVKYDTGVIEQYTLDGTLEVTSDPSPATPVTPFYLRASV